MEQMLELKKLVDAEKKAAEAEETALENGAGN